MRRAVALLLLCPAISLAEPPTNAPDAESDVMEVILNTWSDPAVCSQSNARTVDTREIARSPDAWTGKCVRVRGWWKAGTIFSDRRSAGRERADNSPSSYRDRIGVYGRDEVMNQSPDHPVFTTAIGIVGTCEQLGDGTLMVMGYCHYRGGPYIALSSEPTPIP